MNLTDPNEGILEETPADPTTQKKLRSSLLYIALVSLLAPCIFCWYSTRVQSIEGVLIPGILGLVILLYTMYILYQREQKQDLAPPLWRVSLVLVFLIVITTLATVWMIASIGWHRISGPAILIMGAWAFFLAGRRIYESWSFSSRAVLESTDQVELDMISIRGSHPVYPQLVYRYAGDYRSQLRNERIHRNAAEIRQAIEDGRFRVIIKYLPDEPRRPA